MCKFLLATIASKLELNQLEKKKKKLKFEWESNENGSQVDWIHGIDNGYIRQLATAASASINSLFKRTGTP